MSHQEFHQTQEQVDQLVLLEFQRQCKQHLILCLKEQQEFVKFKHKFHFHHFNILLSNGIRQHLKYKLLIHQNDIQKHIKLQKQEHYLKNNFQNHQNGTRLSRELAQMVYLHNFHQYLESIHLSILVSLKNQVQAKLFDKLHLSLSTILVMNNVLKQVKHKICLHILPYYQF